MRLALFGVVCACRATGEFHCETDEQCRQGEEIGFCEASGYCTLSDTTCPTQRRYVFASPELDGDCLEGVVTGRIVERYVVNDEMGAPVMHERLLPGSEVNLVAQLDDGSLPPVDYRERDGAFSFAAPTGTRYAIAYTQDGWNVLQHDAPHLELGHTVAGRLDRVPVTKPSTLMFTQQPAMAGQVRIASTGIWTETVVGNASSTTSVNWLDANVLSGALGLLDSDKLDRLYFLMTGQVDGYATITAYSAYSLKQTDGVLSTLTGMLTVVTERDQCIQLERMPVADGARLKLAHADLTAVGDTWTVNAVPARDYGYVGGLHVAGDVSTPSTNGTTLVRFVNPFPGTRLIAHQIVAATIPLAAPGLGSTTVGVAVNTFAAVDVAGASCSATARLETAAAIGGNVKIGPTRIDADATPVSLPNGPLAEFTWEHAVDGQADLYGVSLSELSNDGADGTKIDVRGFWQTSTRRVFIDKALLEPGHSYVFGIYTARGLPNAAAGDLVTTSYPYELHLAYSHTFTIN